MTDIDRDDSAPPARPSKKTIPQIREAVNILLGDAIRKYGADEIFADIGALIDETKRRSPVRPITRKRHADPTPEMVRMIRRYARLNPSEGYEDIAPLLNTSIRCVSYAIAGRRDGPMWPGPEYQPDYAPAEDDAMMRQLGLLPPPSPDPLDP